MRAMDFSQNKGLAPMAIEKLKIIHSYRVLATITTKRF
jgi:hypothetical protein